MTDLPARHTNLLNKHWNKEQIKAEMRNIDMLWICRGCKYHRTIHYANGSNGIGCLAHNMENPYPVDIRNIERCPLGRNEKK